MAIRCIRTNSDNPEYKLLVSELDAYLRIKDGDDHLFYAQYNKSDTIKNVIVAFDGNIAVGCGAIKEYSQGIAEVKRMYVPDKYRGRGFATEILKNLEIWAVELNFYKCILETGEKQSEAIQLYKKNNYKIIPNYGQYENVSNSICFEKSLK